MILYKGILFASAIFIAYGSFANTNKSEETPATPHWEVVLMGAPATLDAGNTNIFMNNNQLDILKQNNSSDWDAWSGNLGVSFVIPLFCATECPGQVQWFTALAPQINGYYLSGDINGTVDRFGDFVGDFNDTNYSMDIKSTRLMFDLALTIATYRNFSVYAIAGIGPSWNRIDFDSKANDCVVGMELDDHTDTNFAYEIGAGINFGVTQHLAVTLEYLYAGFNNLDLSEHGNIGGFEVSALESEEFDLSSQAIFLGLRYAF
jgi:opacity protein-like surface antigen